MGINEDWAGRKTIAVLLVVDHDGSSAGAGELEPNAQSSNIIEGPGKDFYSLCKIVELPRTEYM